MRKIFAILISILLIPLALGAPEGEPASFSVDLNAHAGILPSNPFWVLDTTWEKIKLAVTINPNKHKQLALSLAEERLAELVEVTKDGDFKDAKKLQSAYSDALDVIKDDTKSSDDIDFSDLEGALKFEVRLDSHANDIRRVKEQIKASWSDDEVPAELNETLTVLENNVELAIINQRNQQNDISVKLKARFESQNVDAEIERLRSKYKIESQSDGLSLDKVLGGDDLLGTQIKEQLSNQIDTETNIQATAIVTNKSK